MAGHNPGRPESGTTGLAGPAPRHLRGKWTLRRWLLAGTAVLAAVCVGAVAVAAVGYVSLQNNIRSADLHQGPGIAAANAAGANVNNGPLNILVMGTDTRAGANGAFGSVNDSGGYGNSDVMIIVHISADHRSAEAVSIPRDTIAPYPGCTDPQTGAVSAPAGAQILNAALKEGGPSCAVKTIEALTGIRMDHFLVADFNAVVDLTNTLGGVQVCVNGPVVDPQSGLNLPRGTSLVQGKQALAFLRTRHGFGDGSDLGRIKAQQSFLASMVRKIKSEGTLTDIPKMYSIADTVTKNLTVDKAIANIPALLAIAGTLKNIDPKNVTFVTAPNEPYVSDPNRVQLQAQPSAQLFRAIATDTGIAQAISPGPASTPAPATNTGAPTPATPTPGPTGAPSRSPLQGTTSGQTADQSTCQTAYTG